MKMEVDYSKYTISQLLDVKRNIYPEQAPTNYKNLLGELDSRKDELERYYKQQRLEKIKKRIDQIAFLGWLQLCAALVYLTLLGAALIGIWDVKPITLSAVIFSLCLIALNFFAGYLTLKSKMSGCWTSILNQSLQLLHFNFGNVLYGYSGIGGVYVYLSDGYKFGINAKVNPDFKVIIAATQEPSYIGLDVLALFFIVVLALTIRDKRLASN
jgi:hypothetical protein